MSIVDPVWDDWLTTNVSRGCTLESMIEAMVRAGFETVRATEAVRHAMSGTVAMRPEPLEVRTSSAAEYQYDPAPVSSGNSIHAFDRDVEVLMRCERPQIVVFGNVLSVAECEQLIARSQRRLKRSTTVDPDTGSEIVIANRTSEGTWFSRGEDAFIERIDQRIASLMNWPMQNGEGLQVMRYGPGAEYRPHFDYFPPDQIGSAMQTSCGGQRVATLVIYLNDVPEGGETVFPHAGVTVVARRGHAVYFRYMNGMRQLDSLTLHGGAPVAKGEKWIATRWMRERTQLATQT